MTKLGTFAAYLIWTSAIGVFGFTLSTLVNLNPTGYAVNTFAAGTWLGYIFAAINLAIYPLQIGLAFLLCLLFNVTAFVTTETVIIASCLILLIVGLNLRLWMRKRRPI
jgi:hypothetical protein